MVHCLPDRIFKVENMDFRKYRGPIKWNSLTLKTCTERARERNKAWSQSMFFISLCSSVWMVDSVKCLSRHTHGVVELPNWGDTARLVHLQNLSRNNTLDLKS